MEELAIVGRVLPAGISSGYRAGPVPAGIGFGRTETLCGQRQSGARPAEPALPDLIFGQDSEQELPRAHSRRRSRKSVSAPEIPDALDSALPWSAWLRRRERPRPASVRSRIPPPSSGAHSARADRSRWGSRWDFSPNLALGIPFERAQCAAKNFFGFFLNLACFVACAEKSPVFPDRCINETKKLCHPVDRGCWCARAPRARVSPHDGFPGGFSHLPASQPRPGTVGRVCRSQGHPSHPVRRWGRAAILSISVDQRRPAGPGSGPLSLQDVRFPAGPA